MPKNKKPSKKTTIQPCGRVAKASGTRSARERTIRRMKNLLAAGAAAGMAACDWGGVCDPLPPPLECKGNPTTNYFRTWIDWHANWALSGSSFVARVNLLIPFSRASDTLTFDPGQPVVLGGNISNMVRTDTTIAFDITPDAGTTQIDLTVNLNCNGIGESLLLRLDLSEPPSDGQYIPISSRE